MNKNRLRGPARQLSGVRPGPAEPLCHKAAVINVKSAHVQLRVHESWRARARVSVHATISLHQPSCPPYIMNTERCARCGRLIPRSNNPFDGSHWATESQRMSAFTALKSTRPGVAAPPSDLVLTKWVSNPLLSSFKSWRP